jgi:ribosomal protein S20
MSLKSKTMKTLAVVTAAGALTVGGATAAMAADGSGSGPNGGSATAAQRLRNHPGVRLALRAAFGAAADTLGTTAKDLRTQMVQGHQSLASVAGDQSDAVASAIVASLSASIDQAVTNGHFPADRAEQAKSRLPERVEKLMNRVHGQHAQ